MSWQISYLCTCSCSYLWSYSPQEWFQRQPNHIFSLDESGIRTSPASTWKSGSKWPETLIRMFTSDGHTNVTVLECVSASGYALLSVVIFKYKSLTPELHCGEADETIYASSTLGQGLIWKFSVSSFTVNFSNMHHLEGLMLRSTPLVSQSGLCHYKICLYCRYTLIFDIRSAVPIWILIFTAGCINLYDIIKISSNYCIQYLAKSVHMYVCCVHKPFYCCVEILQHHR